MSDDRDGDGDDLAWETLDSAIDYRCPGFEVRRDEVRLPDGAATDYHYVDESPAVVVLPFTPEGDAVVVEEWRQAVNRTNCGLPAGSVEPDDESLAAAARRELREETGYRAASVEPLTAVEPTNGIANSVHHHFVARGCESGTDATQRLDFDESIRARTVEYDDLLAAVRRDEIRDGRAVTAVLRYEVGDG